MKVPAIDIITGKVVRVQLWSQTTVQGRAVPGKPKSPSAVQFVSQAENRMRIFLAPENGREQDFLLINSTVGVREDHKVSVACVRKGKTTHLLCLRNHVTGQEEEVPNAVADLARDMVRGLDFRIPAALVAIIVAGLTFAVIATARPDQNAWLTAVAFGIGAFLVALPVFGIADAISKPRAAKAAQALIRAQLDERMDAFDLPATATIVPVSPS